MLGVTTTILLTPAILAGIILTDDYTIKFQHNDSEDEKNKPKDEISTLSLAELNKRMRDAVKEENYELASKLRDEINKRKGK